MDSGAREGIGGRRGADRSSRADSTITGEERTELVCEITAKRNLNPLRHRSYPRVIKRARHNSYLVKRNGDKGTRHTGPAAIRLANHRGLCKTLLEKVQADSGPERGQKSLQWPSVIREENPPRLEMGDGSLNGCTQ